MKIDQRLVEILSETNFDKVKLLLSSAVEDRTAKWFERYKWVSSATSSTDSFVHRFLDEKLPPSWEANIVNKFDPCLFEEHIGEATRRLDICLARRKEIQELEVTAITAALDYMLSESMQPGALEIAKIELKANRAQANASSTDATEDILIAQDKLQTQMRDLRMTMHATKGNALNYSERIDFLRKLYADDVLSIFERLVAARIGLNLANIAQMRPVPKWMEKDEDNISNLVEWTRDAIREYEYKERLQTVYTRVVRIGQHYTGKVDGAQVYPPGLDGLRLCIGDAGTRSVPFNLSPAEFLMKGTHRILNVGLAVSFKNNSSAFERSIASSDSRGQFEYIDSWHRNQLKQMSFPATLQLPNQKSVFVSGEAFEWTKQPINFESGVGVWDGFPKQVEGWSSQIKNSNPIGEWYLVLDGVVGNAEGIGGPLAALKDGINDTLWNFSDIVLTLEVATVLE